MKRRPPPPFLIAAVASREWLTPRLARVTLEGESLTQLEITQPASSVRVLLPEPDDPGGLELPGWDGNQFILDGGRKPRIRTLTPRLHDRDRGRLSVDVVVHGGGAAARWAATAPIGTPAAVSGPARGYDVDLDTTSLVLGGDETAVPAICQILEALSSEVEASVYLEVVEPEAPPPLPSRPGYWVEWMRPDSRGPGHPLADRLGEIDLPEGARLWAAGEAAAMQRIRHRLFSERGISRTRATIRGYWKHGRTSDAVIENA